MSNELLLYIAFILLLAVFGAIFWLREKQINAKFSKFELAIEGLIKENYQLKKQIKDNAKPQEIIKNDIDMDEINHIIELKINEGLIQKISPILQNVHIIEQAVNEIKDEQQERLYSLEERTKSIGKITPPSFEANNENRVVEMFRAGKTPEAIARDLQLGVGQVTMILKFKKEI
ncbi:MAG: hypothetical protein SPI60_04070 [Campylobacter lanienae]|uniref:DUF6115 domain-containing protein n=1 Tax=Campylobacter lanienae TaxID=75658 RepID=UPI000BB3F687|nr:hypothetical protein [Campylobacter lanienae]MCI5539689.1 hypothetical protein [Campylobacter lanienae]MDD7514962.1 hypothetical protein [Campylobacter lanienae]MDY3132392.1 hypothetical protein [Campylobacter lanienae]MDY5519282.1 hypothetical protein [Campylobacter lanienae]MDY6056963.1 hypothetical protein [Campylobacter lanienae]